MQYFLVDRGAKRRDRGRPPVAHIWDGIDTLCRMHSTGGISRPGRVTESTEGRSVCRLCRGDMATYPPIDTPPITQPDTLPTAEEIEAARTPNGGWTRDQLARWGVPWPPPLGWENRLLRG